MNQPCLVIMAAGMGSRFGGPKQTTPVDEYGHFLLHYSLFDAYRAGFRKVVFVVKEDTAEEFRESVGPAVAAAFDVRYAYQKLDTLPAGYTVPDGRTKPWGTAHAVLCAAPEIDGPFAVINSDDYYGIEAYRLLYDFLAVPRPERSYAMVGFRLCNTVTANGSVSRGICTERDGMLGEHHGAHAHRAARRGRCLYRGRRALHRPAGRYDGVHELLGLLAAVPARARAPVPGVSG